MRSIDQECTYKINYIPPITAQHFHDSSAFVRILFGAVGCGKTSTCCMEIMRKAIIQEPSAMDGCRYSRWLVVRNTYPELRSTTIKDWEGWFPPDYFGSVVYDSPIRHEIQFDDVRLTVWFISMDNPKDIKKMLGMQLTGVWLSECRELPSLVLDMATQRVGRFPDKQFGKPSWYGVIGDTNPCSSRHWIYNMFEVSKKKDYEIFKYAPALIKKGDEWIPNVDADYVQNLSLGYDYYLRQITGKPDEWIKIYIGGEYGEIFNNEKIYPEFSHRVHVDDTILANPGLALALAFDFGYTPACILTQRQRDGSLLVLEEFTSRNIAPEAFAEIVIYPILVDKYANFEWEVAVGDPSGVAGTKVIGATSCIGCLNNLANKLQFSGFKCVRAETNNFERRKNAVSHFLSRIFNGNPLIRIHPRCVTLIRGFNGGYCYQEIVKANGDGRVKYEAKDNDYTHIHDALQYRCLCYATNTTSEADNSFLSKIIGRGGSRMI